MTPKKKFSLPTDPEIIDEYLEVLNKISKENDRTPRDEPIAYYPISEKERTILRKFEQDYQLIEITEKTIPYNDPLDLDPYDKNITIPVVIILDESKFYDFRAKLVRQKQIPVEEILEREDELQNAGQGEKSKGASKQFYYDINTGELIWLGKQSELRKDNYQTRALFLLMSNQSTPDKLRGITRVEILATTHRCKWDNSKIKTVDDTIANLKNTLINSLKLPEVNERITRKNNLYYFWAEKP